MTDKELEDFIHHGETGFLAFAMMFGDGWAQQAIAIAKELRAKLNEPEPEPELDKYLMEVECTKCGAKQDGILTVNAPPQREWVGLTDDDMNKLRHLVDWTVPLDIKKFARAIEAKLKEKNT